MKEKAVINKLSSDVSDLVLPPLSEKVRQAVQNQRRKNSEIIIDSVKTDNHHKPNTAKYILVAALALLAFSVPLVIILNEHTPVTIYPDNSGASEISRSESNDTSPLTGENALERVKIERVYGTVALSSKSEEELEILLVTYSKDGRVYEDSRYIYNFDSQGRLLEMQIISFENDEEDDPATQQIIRQKAIEYYQRYYPEYDPSDDTIDVTENERGRPYWTVCFFDHSKYSDRITTRMEFNKQGDLQKIITVGSEVNLGKITEEKAVEIALQEIESKEYNTSVLAIENGGITVDAGEKGDVVYYAVTVISKTSDDVILMSAYFEISAETGEILYSEI